MKTKMLELMIVVAMVIAALPLMWLDASGELTRAPPVLEGVIDTYFETTEDTYILGNVTVETEGTLVIKPGTTLYTDSSSIITVKGALSLRGSENDPISFVPTNEGVLWKGIRVLGGGSISGMHFSIMSAETAISFSGNSIYLDKCFIANSTTGLAMYTTPTEERVIARLTLQNISEDGLLLEGVEDMDIGYIKARGEGGTPIHLRSCRNITLHDLDLVFSGPNGIFLESDNADININYFIIQNNENGILETGITFGGSVNMAEVSYGLISGAGKAIYTLGAATFHELQLMNLQISALSIPIQLVADGHVSITNVSLLSTGRAAIAVEDASGPEGLLIDLYDVEFDFHGVSVAGENATLNLHDDVNITVMDEPLGTPLEGAHLTVTDAKDTLLFNDTLPEGWTLLRMLVYRWYSSRGFAPEYSFTATAGEEPYTATASVFTSVFDEELPGTVNVTIYLNLPPVFSGEAEVTFAEDSCYLLNLSEVFSDPEGENLTFEATPGDNIVVDLNGTLLNISATENYFGPGSVEVTATDQSGASTTVNITLNITAVNDAPFINAPPDWNITVTAGENYTLDLASMIGDVETPLENLTVRVENCTYATVNGTVITFLFPTNTTINTTYARIEVSDGELQDSALLRITVEGGAAPGPGPGPGPGPEVNITSAEVKIKDGEWIVDVEATPNSTIYIVIEGVGSFRLTETAPGIYHAEIPEENFEEGKKYSYYFSTSEGGENIAPEFSGELKQPEEKKGGLGLAAMAIIVVVVLLVLGVLVYLFTRKKGEGIEEE